MLRWRSWKSLHSMYNFSVVRGEDNETWRYQFDVVSYHCYIPEWKLRQGTNAGHSSTSLSDMLGKHKKILFFVLTKARSGTDEERVTKEGKTFIAMLEVKGEIKKLWLFLLSTWQSSLENAESLVRCRVPGMHAIFPFESIKSLHLKYWVRILKVWGYMCLL